MSDGVLIPSGNDPPLIAGPVDNPRRPALLPPPGAWDTHAHVFGPAERFPFAAGRGYTPPPAPIASYLALLDRLGLARGVVVQGNAHGYDNRVVLDVLARSGYRVRGVAITDTRIAPEALRDWHRIGMRGLRFHVFSAAGRPGYVRGVGFDVFEAFRPVMRELGWVMQVWCCCASSARGMCMPSCRRLTACPRLFPITPTRAPSTPRSSAPTPNG